MHTRREAFLGLFAALALAGHGANSKAEVQPPSRQPVTIEESGPSVTSVMLQSMTGSAGVIFAGQVISVHRPVEFAGADETTASAFVEIVFRVDQALRGCISGSQYTLREWSGLWSGGAERYRPGQRLLMFLRNSNASGLSSTVNGAEGAIPLRGGGAAPGPDDTTSEAAGWLVDLRWIQAQAPRNSRSPLKPIRWRIHSAAMNSLETGAEARPIEQKNLLLRDDVPPWTVPTRLADPQMAPLTQVLNLCRGFVRQFDDAR